LDSAICAVKTLAMTILKFWIAEAILLLLYLVAAIWLPKGYWKTSRRVGKESPETHAAIEQLHKQLQEEERSLISPHATAPTNPLNDFREKLSHAIDYAIGRHDWYEDQRSRMFQTILAVLTFTLAAAGVSLKESTSTWVSYSAIGFFIISIIALVRGAFLYNKELDADRPYRRISNIRTWYFRYNLPKHSSDLEKGSDVLANAQAVADERKRFAARIVDNFDAVKSTREDMEQLFILHVLQRYKSESLARLRWLVVYTMAALFIQFFLYVLSVRSSQPGSPSCLF
jgi:hypothetical protein